MADEIDPRILQLLKNKGFRNESDLPIKVFPKVINDEGDSIEGDSSAALDDKGNPLIRLSREKMSKMSAAQKAALIAHESGHNPNRWGVALDPGKSLTYENQARLNGNFVANPLDSIMAHIDPKTITENPADLRRKGFQSHSVDEIAHKIDESAPYAMDQSNQDIIQNKNIEEPYWMPLMRAIHKKPFPKNQKPPSEIMKEQLKNKSNAGMTKKALENID